MPLLDTARGKIFICKLTSNFGQILTGHEEKEKNVFEFYNSLLGEPLDRDMTINLDVLGFPHNDLSELEAPFSKEEVWRTICSLASDKAPGPDVFTRKFYKSCWPVIKAEVMVVLSAVWSRKIDRFAQLNSAILFLCQRTMKPWISKTSNLSAWFIR
jgi:hypothetical protein